MGKFVKIGLLVVLVLVLGLKLLGIGPFGGSGGELSLKRLQEKARAEGKDRIVVLLTGTSWCPPCMELDLDVISKPEWKSFIETEAVFASYEYGAVHRPKFGPKGEMLKRFDIEGFPTMIVMDGNGVVLGEEAGYGSGGVAYYKEWISSL